MTIHCLLLHTLRKYASNDSDYVEIIILMFSEAVGKASKYS